jgi:hypothetical protein
MAYKKIQDNNAQPEEFHCEEIDHTEIEFIQVSIDAKTHLETIN